MMKDSWWKALGLLGAAFLLVMVCWAIAMLAVEYAQYIF